MADQRYTNDQAVRILQLAARSSTASSQDVSREELLRVAEELGIDADKVKSASKELDRDEALDGGQSSFIGAPPQYEVERLIQGRLSQEAWSRVVAEVERVYGPGTLSGSDVAPTWHRQMPLGWVHLTALDGGGETRLQFSTHIDRVIGAGMVGMSALTFLFGWAIFNHLAMPPWLVALLGILIVIVSAICFRAFLQQWYRSDRLKAETALDAAVASAATHQAAGVLSVDSDANPERLQQQG